MSEEGVERVVSFQAFAQDGCCEAKKMIVRSTKMSSIGSRAS